jgi:hypothetical protein
MADLSRYSVEVGAIADELLDYLCGENYANAKRMLDTIGLEGLENMTREDHDAAVKFVQQAPSARSKKIEKMDGRKAFELLVRARYIALTGARLIAAADRFDMVPGMSYRRAAGFAAEEARRSLQPTLDEILPLSSQYSHR